MNVVIDIHESLSRPMSWTKLDGDAHCELAHVIFSSAKAVGESFPEMVRANDPTSWRDAIFEVIACAHPANLNVDIES